jgi:hypothetical protein
MWKTYGLLFLTASIVALPLMARAQRVAVQLPRARHSKPVKDTVLFVKGNLAPLFLAQPCLQAGREAPFYRAGQDHRKRTRPVAPFSAGIPRVRS